MVGEEYISLLWDRYTVLFASLLSGSFLLYFT